MHYTYLVDHGTNAPSVGAGIDIQGGKLVSVSFYDAMDELDRLREALEFYASPLGWTRSQMEIGSEVMEGDSPCECDRGTVAREALSRLAIEDTE